MDDDREIRDLLAREIQDPDLRRRIFALLDRDPATLTPQEQELFEETVGGILSAETERLRADAERLRGPSWWLRGGGREEAYDDISVRGFLWSLRWIAPGLLVVCLVMWAVGTRGMSLPWALFLWVVPHGGRGAPDLASL